MATLTLSLTSGPVTGSKNYTLSDADVTRWLNALKTLDGAGSLTNAQLLSKWADNVVQSVKSFVKHVERDAAAASASNAITDIGVT